MVVPSLLWSCPGSTRASTDVLSQSEPAPGAVIAAQAAPEDCGALPPLVDFSASTSDMVVGSRATVMSAPTRVSQNGETHCFTDTADEPLAWSCDDHFISPLSPVLFGGAFVLASATAGVSALSRRQSGLLRP